jgi:enediyne polyketide synthase
MTPAIAIVGMACRYPDARSPIELWENVLAQRRAFRRMPPERLRLDDYYSPDAAAPDRTYATEAAVIEGYEFDRVRFQVAGSAFRAADLAHWLALDVAAQALADAGFAEGAGLPREVTGVILGNTLTGEFSRANQLRLRWPYVRRVTEDALIAQGWPRQAFLERLERAYKAPFPPISEESLAGGLSNTIAGRICNHFDLNGGGYTIDGACASSLLAVANACSAISAGDLDVALAGGVDVSLDPFELVGFAKAGALATDDMRIYDARSAGFWPGEGCGFVVLMRHTAALAQHRRVYAVIRGWGISSDGSGGITRPEVAGQLLAVRRAYQRAGFGVESVAYFEGHGTGTSVGDAVELRMLSTVRRAASPAAPAAAIGSIKANIGHTKAAAGIAGLIKTAMALHSQVVPPTTGCVEQHPELTGPEPALRVVRMGELWPADQALRAGVSAAGFGGINTHIALEGAPADRRRQFSSWEQLLLASAQDAELLLLSAPDLDGLRQQLDHLASFAARLSRAELADLAGKLAQVLDRGDVRAAIVTSSPAELARQLATLNSWLVGGATARIDVGAGVFLGVGPAVPQIGLLLPGQGAPVYRSGGALAQRFAFVRDLYQQAALPVVGDSVSTAVAQPAIVVASLAAMRVLRQLGIQADIAIGHSLGELTALHWAGAINEAALLRIAAARGKTMADLGSPTGAMATIGADRQTVEMLLNDDAVVIAGLNAPTQTVISGEAAAVRTIIESAQARGLPATRLPVSHAFHSPLVAAAATALADQLAGERFAPLQRPVISTVTGALLDPAADLRALLYHQVTRPVRFMEAMAAMAGDVDLLIEAGPGRVLSGLVAESAEVPVVALDAGGPTLAGLLNAVGAAFALGVPVAHHELFAGRFTRAFDLDWRPCFFTNPCELAPLIAPSSLAPDDTPAPAASSPQPAAHADAADADESAESPLELVRRLVAARTELPPAALKDESRLLSDLHLNSIIVGQLVAEAARQLHLPPPIAPTDYADATIAAMSEALASSAHNGHAAPHAEEPRAPAGVDTWIRSFTVELIERPMPHYHSATGTGDWRVIAPDSYPLTSPLRAALAWVDGGGVAVCLPPEPNERHVGLLLEGAHAAIAAACRFVLVQHGGSAAAFARTLHLEHPEVAVCVIDVPVAHPQAAEWVAMEALAAAGYSEAYYDAAGIRREPFLRLLADDTAPRQLPLGPSDVLLVTGGGKGITAECALDLARTTGCRLALLGRSQPAADDELAANLDRMAAAGITLKYFAVDVTDAEAVQSAVRAITSQLGTVTGILHGAARNVPRLLHTLDEPTFLSTLAPKIQGLHNLMAVIDPRQLRLLVTFGSIIARMGLPGEADYALANEWLVWLTRRFQADHPDCRCLAVEWSIWADVGMGARLGGVAGLARAGITAIPPDAGVAILRDLLTRHLPTVAVLVTGRFGEPPTLRVAQPELPFLRFLEHQRVFYPGVELVVDVELSATTDPYLADHVFEGERILPAVVGLEAMAQVAMALAETDAPPSIANAIFSHPILVPPHAPTMIRLAALVRAPGCIEVTLRSQATHFQLDCFRATCRFATEAAPSAAPHERAIGPLVPADLPPPLGIDPARDLYGKLLFHSGRFQRVRGYRQLSATGCIAEIAADDGGAWFGRYLPATLVLGDPGAHDALIHAIQVCVPSATLLPIGVESLLPSATARSEPRFVHARERSHAGDVFTYDVALLDGAGQVLETWLGLRLRTVGGSTIRGPWAAPIFGPYIERQVQKLIPGAALTVTFEQDGNAERRARSDRVIQRAIGRAAVVRRRPDGKPEVEGGPTVSAAHAGDLTLAVAGGGPLACDVELVTPRTPAIWRDLLGAERFALAELIAERMPEDAAAAATRIWSACECLKKAGIMQDAPLVLAETAIDSWVVLSAGALRVATWIGPIRGPDDQHAIAVLARSDDARI